MTMSNRREGYGEKENTKLKDELEFYKSKKFAGRQKHDEHWMKSYNDFVIQYENGLTIMEIVDQGAISRRTAYSYKAYYLRRKGCEVTE